MVADKERNAERVRAEPDFVNSPKHGNSLKRVMDASPDGVEPPQAAKMLCCTEEELEEMRASAVEIIRGRVAGRPEDLP